MKFYKNHIAGTQPGRTFAPIREDSSFAPAVIPYPWAQPPVPTFAARETATEAAKALRTPTWTRPRGVVA